MSCGHRPVRPVHARRVSDLVIAHVAVAIMCDEQERTDDTSTRSRWRFKSGARERGVA
jgi:hypothetical protein